MKNEAGDNGMFDVSKVSAVYTGRQGCACGCKGKYSYASKFKCERPSYLEGEEGINDRTVKMLTKKIEKIVRETPERIDRLFFDADWFAIDMADTDRSYTIYFAKEA